MLRPKRMSKVSVTGSKAVMDDVIETAHDLHVLHLSDYDGRWDGFTNGDPVEGAEEASQKLVTVRSLENILDVEPEDAGRSRIVDDEELDAELEDVRTEANDLDDRREELRGELREIDERVDELEPFAALGIDLDLLWGYDSLSVAVGEGDPAEVEAALADLDAATGVFAEDDVIAAVARTDEGALADALVGATFSEVAVPEEEGDPRDVLGDLEERRQSVESKLETVENQLEDLRYDVAGFLLAAEEKLDIEVQKAEAPLSFATTRNAFVAEGWLPTERVEEFEAAVDDAVGEHADVETLETAEFDRHGYVARTEDETVDSPVDQAGEATAGASQAAGEQAGEGAAADDDADAEPVKATDGGTVAMRNDDPPVVQDNPGTIQPFELLTKAVGRPNYTEFDPTILLFLTFPLMFGFIIGDVGYGIIYAGIGYYFYSRFDSAAFENIGIIAAAAGFSTAVFGVLYGEIFGLHLVTEHLWTGALDMDHAPLAKGLAPNETHWAQTWFVVTTLFGVLHLSIGYLLEFVEEFQLHGLTEAVLEAGSWLLALNGLWLFIFSRFLEGPKPGFLWTIFDGTTGPTTFALGFSGFPAEVGMAGLAMFGLGALLIVLGPTHEIIEIHVVLGHALSYLRISAVLLAKAGMAFAANLLFFGAYQDSDGYHFLLSYGPEEVTEGTVMFDGMMHMGPAMLVFGIVVLILAHLVVLILGVTSAGIQSIRLEYFEFFEKFYEGNGRTYSPFGREREHTSENR